MYDATVHAYISFDDETTLALANGISTQTARLYIGDDIQKAKTLVVEKIWLSKKASGLSY